MVLHWELLDKDLLGGPGAVTVWCLYSAVLSDSELTCGVFTVKYGGRYKRESE